MEISGPCPTGPAARVSAALPRGSEHQRTFVPSEVTPGAMEGTSRLMSALDPSDISIVLRGGCIVLPQMQVVAVKVASVGPIAPIANVDGA